MVYVNQLHLIEKGVEKNKRFLEKIYANDELVGVDRWFDCLDCNVSFARQPDDKMTLDDFVKGVDENSYAILQFASPEPFSIRYCVSFRDWKDVKHFSWVICPYNDVNFKVFSDIYRKTFGKTLEKEPVMDGLIEYYEQRVKNGF